MSGWLRAFGGIKRLATCALADLRVSNHETIQVTEHVTEKHRRLLEIVVVGEVHAGDLTRNRLPGQSDDWSRLGRSMAPHIEDRRPTLMAEPVFDEGKTVSRGERILNLVRRMPGLRVSALVKATGYSPATVRRAVVALRQAGLVEFHGAPKRHWPVVQAGRSSESTEEQGGDDGQEAPS